MFEALVCVQMSRAQEPHRPFLPFGNPFRMILPKDTHLSPKLLALLNNFEDTLATRLKKLKPADKEDVLRVSWMISAMVALCEIHTDIKTLITSLELPVSDWEDKWIDVYFANSVKLLDICISFSSEVARLKQGHLYLQCVLHDLSSASSNQFVRARSSLDGWSKHIASKNPRLDNCFSVMDSLVKMLDEPKVKNSSKGKVLMRAMYGVKVVTLFICSIFAAAFSGSPNKLIDLTVPESYLWAGEFMAIQAFINTEIRSIYSTRSFTILKELEAVDMRGKKLYPIVQEDGVDPTETGVLKESTLDLKNSVEIFSQGLDHLAKEVDRFFQIVLTGRDALISNLRIAGDAFDQVRGSNTGKDQMVR
ncbi:protein BPS1, chloroplastic isoform X1 [Primulina huaijiensis]|uniref:protein BPS1, chloroplastic isoform X1 n=2 Tax=Primulina huaijiensis TaxID=1492673 RepID=UPI003CC6E0C9